MRIIEFLLNNLLIVWSLAGSLICFCIAFALRRKSCFLSLSVLLNSLISLEVLSGEKSVNEFVMFGLLLQLAWGAFLYFVLTAALDLREWVAKRKKQRLEEGKALLFSLPDKENTFLQERLQTSLSQKSITNEYGLSTQLQLEYVRKNITKLKGAKLSPADRLAVENYSRIVTAYMSAESLSAEELLGLNDTFSALLKMSAKYAV